MIYHHFTIRSSLTAERHNFSRYSRASCGGRN